MGTVRRIRGYPLAVLLLLVAVACGGDDQPEVTTPVDTGTILIPSPETDAGSSGDTDQETLPTDSPVQSTTVATRSETLPTDPPVATEPATLPTDFPVPTTNFSPPEQTSESTVSG